VTELIAAVVALVVIVAAIAVALTVTTIAIAPGTLALLLRRGKATRRVLDPGRHFLPPWRKAMVESYPSRELTLVAGGASASEPSVEWYDDPLRLHLGDRIAAEVRYTVRVQLDPTKLQDFHNRFGPEGLWSALRDVTRDVVIDECAGDVTVDDAFGERFGALERRLRERLDTALGEVGFVLKMFTLREIDLGETGQVIQSTLRTGLEVEREQATAALRTARIENDAALAVTAAAIDSDVLLRYRQLEIWQEMLERWDGDRSIPSALTMALTTTAPLVNTEAAVQGDTPPADGADTSEPA
jgi:regulator of protease activity HflC (stomatin/prohibitin superfamily)